MRQPNKPSWSKNLSLGAVLILVWALWFFTSHALGDLLAASFVQLQPGVSAPSTQKDIKESSKLEFHAWVDERLADYEESEQRHLFLLEKSKFYTDFQSLLEKTQAGWVIYRPSKESTVVWIKTLAPVQKGAGVIIGDCLVGFVDTVQGLCSRVRLVCDTRSKVAVEVKKANRLVEDESANASIAALSIDVKYWKELAKQGVFHGSKKALEIERFLGQLDAMLESTSTFESLPLQGLLCGASSSWPGDHKRLIAQGFYRQVGVHELSKEKEDLIEPGDLLITCGLDGRYPPGLRVGYVRQVKAQDPARTLFEVEASMALADFSKERWVWVLPALTSVEEGSSVLNKNLRP